MSDLLPRQRDVLRRFAARLKARQRGCRGPCLVLMTDDRPGVDWEDAVGALPRGSAVIVRDRDAVAREQLAKMVMRVAKPRGILTLVAADPKLAFRLRADGVHIPEASLRKLSGWKRAFPGMLVTASAHGRVAVIGAQRQGVHAILLSPLFPTNSHPGAMELGPLRWAQQRSGVSCHILALGGITADNALLAISVGANGLAMIGAWIEKS